MPELWEVKGAAKIRLFGPKDALDRVQTPAGVNQGRVAPDELLWLGDPEQAGALEAEGKRQLAGAGERALVVDNSDGWALFSIVGDGRADALARLSSLRLPDEGFRQGKVADVPGKVFARPGLYRRPLHLRRALVRPRAAAAGWCRPVGLTAGPPPASARRLEGQRGGEMSGLFKLKEFWREHPLQPSYDVVIIGGGAHGLSTAYELAAKHGVKSVAVLDKGYIGAGGSGRNTTIIRANYRTPEGVAFYRGEPQDLPAALAGARLQPADLEARPPHARALRALGRGAARARRGQPADGRRLALRRVPRGRQAVSRAEHEP